jgi:hypothetical protein
MTSELYWRGGPAETSERTLDRDGDTFWAKRTARRCARQMRELAAALPDDAPKAEQRRACLLTRAAEIEAGQSNPVHHFRVAVPFERVAPSGRKSKRVMTYPCSGCLLYTFDEAWLLMETFAARSYAAGTECDVWAEGRGQNFTLDIIYDGIADPMREVSPGPSRENP